LVGKTTPYSRTAEEDGARLFTIRLIGLIGLIRQIRKMPAPAFQFWDITHFLHHFCHAHYPCQIFFYGVFTPFLLITFSEKQA
jgi:hypothetical protein